MTTENTRVYAMTKTPADDLWSIMTTENTRVYVEIDERNPRRFAIKSDSIKFLHNKGVSLPYFFPEIEDVRPELWRLRLDIMLRPDQDREEVLPKIVADLVAEIWYTQVDDLKGRPPELTVGKGLSEDFIKQVFAKAHKSALRVLEQRLYRTKIQIENLNDAAKAAQDELFRHEADLVLVKAHKPE